jgi:phospholipid/cholesterol/gamma-HCH transport system ATP-binding protein
MSDQERCAVRFEHVTKTFGERRVLNDISFEVPEGEALCIMGRSGQGKSVTLKLSIALIRPDQGKIWIEGQDIASLEGEKLSEVRRKMGFLFQDAALFDSFSLYENLALPLHRLSKKPWKEINEAVDNVLCQVGLQNEKKKMPGELSGGMGKRAGLARALVLEPKVLLVDEPSSGLDRITASEIDELLLKQKTERHTTLIVVTHDVYGARRVGDKFAILENGSFVSYGTAYEVEHSENATARKLLAERER